MMICVHLQSLRRFRGHPLKNCRLNPPAVPWSELKPVRVDGTHSTDAERSSTQGSSPGKMGRARRQRRPRFSVPLGWATFLCILFTFQINKQETVWCEFCLDPPFPEKNEIHYGPRGECPVKTGVKARKPEKPHAAFSNFIHIRRPKSLEREKKKIGFSVALFTVHQQSCLGCRSESWVKPKTRMPDTVSVPISEIGWLMTS